MAHKGGEPQLLSIEAIIQKASIRKSFDQIPNDMKRLFFQEMVEKEKKDKHYQKRATFYVNNLKAKQSVNLERRKIVPFQVPEGKSQSLNSSKHHEKVTQKNCRKKRKTLEVVSRKSFTESTSQKGQLFPLERNENKLLKEKTALQKSEKKKENPQPKKIARFQYEIQLPEPKKIERKGSYKLRSNQAEQIQNRTIAQKFSIQKSTIRKKNSTNSTKIPDYILLQIPKTQQNQESPQKIKSSSHIKFTEQPIKNPEKKPTKPFPKCLITMKQKVYRKPKTADHSEEKMEPQINLLRLQKKQKYKTFHLKSHQHLNRGNNSIRKERKKVKDEQVCGWQVSDHLLLFNQYY